MRKVLLPRHLFSAMLPVLAVLACAAPSRVWAQSSGFFNDYVVVTANGTQTYYALGGGASGTSFQGLNLGTFNPSAGQTLTLNGFQAHTFQNSNYNVYQAGGFYSVSSGGPSGGSDGNLGVNGTGGNVDKTYQNLAFNANLLSGLSNGTYSVSVFIKFDQSQNNVNQPSFYDSNGGANYTATFTVVPEPSTWAAGILSVSAVAFTQRRRFSRLLKLA